MASALALPLLAAGAAVFALDGAAHWREGGRTQLAETLFYELRAQAFPGSGRPGVAVHVPRGFDPVRRPGAVVYFHGWNGCVQAALADDDAQCSEDGPPRFASRLASRLDDAGVNALLVAVELRADATTGEVGELAQPGALRGLLDEVLTERLSPRLGVVLDVDALDRVMVIAHSGGYQAAATALRFGEVPRLTEVVLLDALYGADDVFDAALQDRSLRLVNLYTYSGGTRERSLRMVEVARDLGRDVLANDGDDADDELQQGSLSRDLSREIVVVRVPGPHAELPSTYMQSLLRAAGFGLAP
jgi:hypothetical protein